jgi:YhcH/YjgK/YiaL family protein
MIYDNLDNIAFYKGLSPDIYEGLNFLQQVTPDIEVGTYRLSPNVKAIVSEYTTKEANENGYETHRQYIDIQYLLKGNEKIACLPVGDLSETKSYSEETDAAFYNVVSELSPSTFDLRPGYFAIFYPQDGHMPQLCINEPEMVKKVVVKVRITDDVKD